MYKNRLKCKINADISILNELHRQHWWIPDQSMIRPTQKVSEDKMIFSNYVLHNWMSFKDFILDTHFNYQKYVEDGHIYTMTPYQSEWKFIKSLFPYDIPTGVNHYVLWNSYFSCLCAFEDDTVNTIINTTLESINGIDNFDFVWYINPKLSIPELWHCQVFWIRI
jgi:hypothetical protein